MNETELRERLAKLYAEGAQLSVRSKDAGITDDEATRLDAIMSEVEDLKPKYADAQRRAAAANALTEGHAHFNQPATGRASGQVPNGGSTREENPQGPDRRSPGRRFVQSDQLRRALASGQSRPSMAQDPVPMGSLFGSRYGLDHDGETIDTRALIGSGTTPGSMLLPQVMPTIYRADQRRPVVRDVLINARTNSDTIRVMQESGFTNNAAEVAEAVAVNGAGLTGGVKPESAMTFTEVDFPVQTIAHWVPITRQLLQDLPAMESYINERLITGLLRREGGQLLNGNGTAPNLRGILQTSGIQVLDAAAFTAAPVEDAGTPNENLNRIRRAIRLIEDVGAVASFIIVNPADAEVFDTMTDANRQYMAGGPFGGVVRTYWGRTVVEESNIAAGTALVGDGQMAGVFDRMEAQIFTTDSHSDFFIRNLLVLLAEERLALAVFRPAAFAKVELAA